MIFDPNTPTCGNTTTAPPAPYRHTPTGHKTLGVCTPEATRRIGKPTTVGAAIIARNEVARMMRAARS